MYRTILRQILLLGLVTNSHTSHAHKLCGFISTFIDNSTAIYIARSHHSHTRNARISITIACKWAFQWAIYNIHERDSKHTEFPYMLCRVSADWSSRLSCKSHWTQTNSETVLVADLCFTRLIIRRYRFFSKCRNRVSHAGHSPKTCLARYANHASRLVSQWVSSL